jgi:hypothetical protein
MSLVYQLMKGGTMTVQERAKEWLSNVGGPHTNHDWFNLGTQIMNDLLKEIELQELTIAQLENGDKHRELITEIW